MSVVQATGIISYYTTAVCESVTHTHNKYQEISLQRFIQMQRK